VQLYEAASRLAQYRVMRRWHEVNLLEIVYKDLGQSYDANLKLSLSSMKGNKNEKKY